MKGQVRLSRRPPDFRGIRFERAQELVAAGDSRLKPLTATIERSGDASDGETLGLGSEAATLF
jgi:hypothetical protein